MIRPWTRTSTTCSGASSTPSGAASSTLRSPSGWRSSTSTRKPPRPPAPRAQSCRCATTPRRSPPMPRITAEQRAELEAQLAEDDADADDYQVTVTSADGFSFTGTFKWALQLGLVQLPDAKPDPKAKPARNVSVFTQRKTS